MERTSFGASIVSRIAVGAPGLRGPQYFKRRAATRDPKWVKWTLIALFLLLPLITVFYEALRKGWDVYLAAIVEPDALSAIKLTLIAAVIAVPLNVAFGLAAA